VAYDEKLAGRMRELVGGERGVTEQRMFGGLAFLVGGNMAIAASSGGGALVRCDPAESNDLVAKTRATPFEMRGREMQGWLRVSSDDLQSKRELERWVDVGVAYARALPQKR
jgi:TfoX/Sxy family transcriptional regulator of competence genes